MLWRVAGVQFPSPSPSFGRADLGIASASECGSTVCFPRLEPGWFVYGELRQPPARGPKPSSHCGDCEYTRPRLCPHTTCRESLSSRYVRSIGILIHCDGTGSHGECDRCP